MTESGVAASASDLVKSFFLRIPGTEVSPAEYFERTFVEPKEFGELLARMSPSSPPRLLVWDGQSRIGKTWSAAGAVRTMLECRAVDLVWTSGEDSHLVYDPSHTWRGRTLLDAFKEVERRVKDLVDRGVLHGRVVILLDDFVGTARLRTIPTSSRDLAVLAGYFAPDADTNPLLRILARLPAATLAITGRSSVFTSARVRLGLPFDVRDHVSRGVFQTIDGRFIGAVDGDWLADVVESHSSFIRTQPEFLLPPVAAFAAEAPQELTSEPQLARILFGGDLAEFADEIEAVETFHLDAQIIDKMDDIYLLYVAPALMFPERATEGWLWASGVASLRRALFLHPGAEGVHLRVPNKFYLRAVTMHLADPSRLEVLARVLRRKIPKISDERQRSVLIRGFLERLLDWGEDLTPGLADAAEALVADQDPLLRWEKEAVLRVRRRRPIDAATVLAHPGLASAVGWATLKFPLLGSGNVGKDFVKDVAERIRVVTDEDHARTPAGSYADPGVTAVSYSNLLRWFAYDVDAKGRPRSFERLGREPSIVHHRPHKQPTTSDLVQMVFEDVIVWADGIKAGATPVRVNHVRAAEELRKSMRADLATSSLYQADDYAAWQIANRLFSLTWHNEWMSNTDSYYRDIAGNWLDRFLQVGLSLVSEHPDLLAVNLQYHWHHMLAQWAVWTRDWCFASNTETYEHSRQLSSAPGPESNKAIRALLGEILQRCSNERDVRNAFFLLGSREAAVDDASPLLDGMSRFSDAAHDNKLWQGCLQAIYELARQGFLDPPAPRTMGERPSVHSPTTDRRFREACHAFYCRHHNETTWIEYLRDLRDVTHLDVIPSAPNDILPPDWASDILPAAKTPSAPAAPALRYAPA